MKSLRSALMILVVLFPLSLAAQSHELSVFLSQPQLDSGSLFSIEGIDVNLDFDEDISYGAAYNRFWTDRFSTEFAVQRISAGATIEISGGGVSESFDAGDFDLTALTGIAQWHFAGSSRFAPYLGGGIAYTTGEAETPEDPTDPASPTQTVDLEAEASIVANAGIDIRVSPRVAIAVDAKYFTYDAKADEPDAESLGLDTLVLSAGVKVRF